MISGSKTSVRPLLEKHAALDMRASSLKGGVFGPGLRIGGIVPC
jgi:hypothetical protein